MELASSGANQFARIAGALAAILGVLMLVGGLGIGFALLTSSQPKLQLVTAVVLSMVGLVNLRSTRRVWNGDPRVLFSTGAATAALMTYFGVGLRDFGEPFWAHGVYLLLLFASWSRAAMRHDVAA